MHSRYLIFILAICLSSLWSFGQNRFEISGRLENCFNNPSSFNLYYGLNSFNGFTVEIEDQEFLIKKKIGADSSGKFEFSNLSKAEYRITTYFIIGKTDTIIKLNSDVNNLKLCVDKNFKPLPGDSLLTFINSAKHDISANILKIYKLSTGI